MLYFSYPSAQCRGHDQGADDLAAEGVEVTPEVTKCLSPYLTEHLKHFGQYVLDIHTQPEPLQPKPLFATTA